MLTKEQEKKLEELQYALRCKGILKTKDELFDMMIELVKREIQDKFTL
jgi:hypothetical protein